MSNPLGARALYLFNKGGDTGYRLHGTPEWNSIGKATSSGCIRLMNQDIIDLYERALKIDENFPNAHHNLGVAYRKKGQLNKSVRSLRRAQRTQQRHEVAEARESIGKWAGPNFGKYMKWIVWGAVIVAGYFLLRAAGYI